MKRIFVSFSAFFLFCFALNISAQNNLETLYKTHRFFELRDAIKNFSGNPTSDFLFYQGAAANKFNRSAASIAVLQEFLKLRNDKADAKMKADSYALLSDDYIKTYRYAAAADALKILTTDYRNVLDADEIKDNENDFKLYNSLRNVPAQAISFDGETKIQATRDQAKLLNLPVEINSQKINFVFDTGANLSTMTVSTAQKLGLKIIESDFDVGTTTKTRVKSKLAVAPLLKIGSVTIRNAVFLVFDDSALFFPQVNYQINAIIGFPVIEALRQFALSKDDMFIVSAQPKIKTSLQNLALDGLSPLVQGVFNNQKMTFIFDTGAQTSALHPPFFESQKENITSQYSLQKSGVGGAGGAQQVDSYVLKDFSLEVGGKTAHFPKINLYTEIINDQTKSYDGNLGQDLIRQFDMMTLNFDQMSLSFE